MEYQIDELFGEVEEGRERNLFEYRKNNFSLLRISFFFLLGAAPPASSSSTRSWRSLRRRRRGGIEPG